MISILSLKAKGWISAAIIWTLSDDDMLDKS
jgi:hypothetical protein